MLGLQGLSTGYSSLSRPAGSVPRRLAWLGVACLVIGMCVYALDSEPAGWGRSAGKGGLAEFSFIKTAAAGDLDKGLSLRAPEKGRVTVNEHAAPWRVVAATGSAHYQQHGRSPFGWQAVSVGLTIEAYAELDTGADGRLELFNGHDRMTLAPNSRVGLPHPIAGVPHITILQSAGNVNYEVESRRKPSQAPTGLLSKIGRVFLSGSRPKGRFEVHTPYLVATVKGTAFGVSVSEERASVSVTEGVVGVSSTAGGGATDVSAGETASAAPSTGKGVSVGAVDFCLSHRRGSVR